MISSWAAAVRRDLASFNGECTKECPASAIAYLTTAVTSRARGYPTRDSARNFFLTRLLSRGYTYIHTQVGAIVLGVLSDNYGRVPAFKMATSLVLCFGLLTVAAPSYYWLLFFRTMVGIGAGGMEVPFDLIGEVLPKRLKGR